MTTNWDADMREGKKFLALKNYETATEHFSIALQKMSETFGDQLDPRLAEAYYYYGLSLFEHARGQGGLFDEPEVEAEDDDDEESAPVPGAAPEAGPAPETAAPAPGPAPDNDEEDPNAEIDVEDGMYGDEARSPVEIVSNYQIAWETLELAKVLYTKDLTPEGQTRLAAVYAALGDISNDQGQYEEAIRDYAQAISVLQKLPDPDAKLTAKMNLNVATAAINRIQTVNAEETEATRTAKNAKFLMGASRAAGKAEELLRIKANAAVSKVTGRPVEGTRVVPWPSVTDAPSTVEQYAEHKAEYDAIMEMMGEVKEKVEALAVIKQSMPAAAPASGVLASRMPESTTTIGFGQPSNNNDAEFRDANANKKRNTPGPDPDRKRPS